MEPRKRILISLIILVVLVVAFYFITAEIAKPTSSGYSVSEQNTEFEKCLSGKSLVLYINSENTDETLRNIVLIDYLHLFRIQNCFSNNQPCLDNNIDSFPTWIINEKRVAGELTVDELGKDSGCNGK